MNDLTLYFALAGPSAAVKFLSFWFSVESQRVFFCCGKLTRNLRNCQFQGKIKGGKLGGFSLGYFAPAK